jgi:RpiR family transcriptional regulator, carbohydrate utilization regulator
MIEKMLKGTMPIAGKHRRLTELGQTCVQRPLLADLEALIPCLNPVMRRVAEYILLDPERVLSSSILDMKRGSGASAGSIVGFCRTFGIKGFLDFKIALARGMIQHPK